jgi:DAK2 domain fusion protein YloV
VNALNVYPVPDGDTGTNMLHTIRSALAYARNAEPTVAAVSAAAAQGALMGARGNSGVILSQIIRGLKDALAEKTEITGPDICVAYASAREHAYKAVTQPAPGTMLSALADIADAVGHGREDPGEVLKIAVDAGVSAVERTQDANPMNKAAGVVDAGARGLWLLLDGALARLEGRAPTTAAPVTVRPSAPTGRAAVSGHENADVSSWKGAYDVQFLVPSPSRPPEVVKEKMMEFGADCVLVVGDETALKVHVHTLQPDKIIAIGMSVGRITDVVVEDLEAMAAEHERTTGIVVPTPRSAIGVVAVLPGDGFVEVARSMGATPLRGGATMNPSTQELLDAIRATNADHVLVLPNDKNVIPAARQAATLADRDVTVVETRTVPQGMSALVAFDATHAVADVIAAVQRAARDAHGIELTHAVRDSTVDGRKVRAGDAIALLDGKLVAHGADEADVLGEAAGSLEDPSLLTLYFGSSVGAERVDRAREALRRACAGAEVEVVDGGQPHYPFLVAAE